MADAGTLSVHFSHVWPYTRGNIFAQPLDWLEAGFRYSEIANRPYDPSGGGGKTYKDKSFDAKFRLWRESSYAPELAIGFRDIVGTGLYSSEYLVGSKRYGPLDLSVGLGWGYIAGHSRPFDARQQVGNFDFHNYFSGRPAFFGGLQYHTAWQPLLVKLERESNAYQQEAFANSQPQRTHWNFGLTYRATRGLDLSLGIERGNRLMVGLAFYGRVDVTYAPKLNDPAPVPHSPRPPTRPHWTATAGEITRQTGWRVGEGEQSGRDLRVTLLDPEATYWNEHVDRAAAVLNRDAPPEIDRFTLAYRERGVDLAEHVIDRDTGGAQHTRPRPPHQKLEAANRRAPEPGPGGRNI